MRKGAPGSSPILIRTLLRGAPLALGLLVACASSGSMARGDGVFKVPGSDARHHRLRYLDGQVSLNDSCMIRVENPLNPKVPPMYVNGQPVGFC